MDKAALLFNTEARLMNRLDQVHHPVLRQLYDDGVDNNWDPKEIKTLPDDRAEFLDDQRISSLEKQIVLNICSLFAVGESLISTNIGTVLQKYITQADARNYMLRHGFEEAIHNKAILTLVDTFSLDSKPVYEALDNVDSIHKFAEHMESLTKSCDYLDMDKTEHIQKVLRLMFNYYLICEGLFFYGCFAAGLSLGRQGKLPGFCTMLELNMRDENNHVKSGVYMLNVSQEQYPEAWTEDFKAQLYEDMKTGLKLADEFNNFAIPKGILGLTPEFMREYLEVIANRRLKSVNLEAIFENDKNPFPWLSDLLDLERVVNFFEGTVTKYRDSSSLIDDF